MKKEEIDKLAELSVEEQNAHGMLFYGRVKPDPPVVFVPTPEQLEEISDITGARISDDPHYDEILYKGVLFFAEKRSS